MWFEFNDALRQVFNFCLIATNIESSHQRTMCPIIYLDVNGCLGIFDPLSQISIPNLFAKYPRQDQNIGAIKATEA